MGAPLGALPFVRKCRSDLLRLRMGNHALRSRLLRHLSRQLPYGAPSHHALDRAMDGIPVDVRRGPDQIARRSLLAQSDVPRLFLRNAADAESAQLELPLVAAMVPARRSCRQSLYRAGGSICLFHAPTLRHDR